MEIRQSFFLVCAMVLGGLVVGAGAGYWAGLHGSQPAAIADQKANPSSLVRNPGNSQGFSSTNSEPNSLNQIAAPNYQPIRPEALLKEISSLGLGNGGMSSMRQWAVLMERVSVSDCAALASHLAQNKNQPGVDMAWHLVMSAFAENDPQAAWNFALGLPSAMERNSAMSPVISAMAATDPQAAMTRIDQITDHQLQRYLRSMVAINLASKNPRQAFELIQNAEVGEKAQFLNTIFFQWAEKDIEGAKAAMSGLSGNDATMARHALVSAVAQNNPREAWALANSFPSTGSSNADGRLQVIQVWAQEEPNAALQAANGIQEPGTRARAISSAVSTWASKDFPAALNYSIGVQDATLRSDVLRSLSDSSDIQNPGQLLNALLEHMPPGDNFQQSVNSLITTWASKNTAEAAAAISQLPPGRVFSQATSRIASQWSSSGEPMAALTWAKTLPDGEGRQSALNALFSDWSSQSPESAVAALSSLAPEDRKRAVRAVAGGWSRQNPEAVLRWSASLADPAERNDVQRDAISQWAGSSPEAAAKYVAGLTAENQGRTLETVISRWAAKDAESAGDWLMQQPSSQGKDAAISTVAKKIASEDPETALSWAGNITDSKRRERELESIARDWIKHDPKTAKAWISKSKLPEDLQNKLLGN